MCLAKYIIWKVEYWVKTVPSASELTVLLRAYLSSLGGVTARRRRYPDTLIPDNREMYKLSLVSLQNQMVLYKKGRPVSWIRGINNLAIKASSLEYDLTVPDSCYLICKQLNLSQWDSNLEPIFHLAAETGWSGSGCPGQHHNTSSPHHPFCSWVQLPSYNYFVVAAFHFDTAGLN